MTSFKRRENTRTSRPSLVDLDARAVQFEFEGRFAEFGQRLVSIQSRPGKHRTNRMEQLYRELTRAQRRRRPARLPPPRRGLP